MSDSVQSLLLDVSKYRYDPAGIQASAINLLRDITDGKVQIVDPSNPVVFCLEAASTMTAAFMTENKTLTRKQYPAAAQTVEEIYPHMSDKDHVDRFAVPATTRIFMLINEDELYNSLTIDPENPGIRKLVLPRNTYITVADETIFSIQYPVEIRQMAHEGLQIVHIADQISPLKVLTTNQIPWTTVVADDGARYIGFELEVDQFFITSREEPLNLSTGFSVEIEYSDQYYYCRVFINNGNNTYTEIKTTYTDEVYDTKEPTAVIKVLERSVRVKIPQIYLTLGMLNKSLRIDVYQTKGPIEIDLGNYHPGQFVATFESKNVAEINDFVTPLKSLKTLRVHSTRIASGGADAMSFDELRSRVMKNAVGSPDLPITPAQIEAALSRQGYKVVKNIDNITNRTFLATRDMPDPDVDSDLITAAAAGIGMLATKLSEAVLVDSVIDNGDIVTITPNTLYRQVGGILQIVPTNEIQTLRNLPVDQLAIAVSNNSYLYSPFHYVLDSTGNEFEIRPYYLDNPVLENKSFIGENDKTLLQVSTSKYLLSRTEAGYNLRIQTKSSDDFKQLPNEEIFVQLAFIPQGEAERAYLLGTLIGIEDDERVYEFEINTNYSINNKHGLSILDFQMYDDSERVVPMDLLATFDILYSTNTSIGSQWEISDIDAKLGYFQLPQDIKAINNDQVQIRFGHYLKHLWARSRSVVSDENYERWEMDIAATYEQDVYERDPVTGAAFSIVNGELVYTVLHHKGDEVFIGEDPVFKHRKGDVKLDSYGNPIVKSSRDMQRQMELFLVEGTYYFATNQVSIDYRKKLVNTVVDWLTEDLPNMGGNLLENTDIFFYPVTSQGRIDVMFGAGLTTTIEAGQSFEVNLFVSGSVYANNELRNAISRNTIRTISQALDNRTVSISDITERLRETYESDIIAFNVRGLGGASNYAVLTVVDDVNRLAIRKRLENRNDDSLAVTEAITINFTRHERSDIIVS